MTRIRTLRQVLKDDKYAVVIPMTALEEKKTAIYQFNVGYVWVSPAMFKLYQDPLEKESMLDAIKVESRN
jgi:hypothetical protein